MRPLLLQRLIQHHRKPPQDLASRFGTKLVAALAVLGLIACGSGPAPIAPQAPVPSSAQIWFHPLPAGAESATGSTVGGSTDFIHIFQDNAPWPHARAKTQVFGVYAGWLTSISDDQFQSFIQFLTANNMAIEVEAPALQATASCGTGVEGYVPYGQTIHDFTFAYLQRLKAHGFTANNGPPLFIKVDEPYFFGSVVGDPRSCHLSTEQVAAQVGQYVQLVQTVYPHAIVGDVEPVVGNAYVPDIVTALDQWHDTYKAVTGSAFPFYFADIDFSDPAWPTIVKQLEDQTHHRGMNFGIIYIGDITDTSDNEWAGKVVSRFQTYQLQGAGHPDYVLFQSWEPHPTLCLPETNPITFTGVIDAYLDAIQ